MSVGIVLVGVFFVLLCLRVPVAAAMGLASIVGMLYAGFGISMFKIGRASCRERV